MKYFIDTDFIERGPRFPIALISIGIVAEDGRTLYMVSSEFDPNDAYQWVKDHVLSHIEMEFDDDRSSLSYIAESVRQFVAWSGDEKPEFWGYYCDYDWVVFCQMFGAMMDLPQGWPMYCRDIKQLCDDLGNPNLPPHTNAEHNALDDAIWNKQAYEFLQEIK